MSIAPVTFQLTLRGTILDATSGNVLGRAFGSCVDAYGTQWMFNCVSKA